MQLFNEENKKETLAKINFMFRDTYFNLDCVLKYNVLEKRLYAFTSNDGMINGRPSFALISLFNSCTIEVLTYDESYDILQECFKDIGRIPPYTDKDLWNKYIFKVRGLINKKFNEGL